MKEEMGKARRSAASMIVAILLTVGVVPAAGAVATYDVEAEFKLWLVDVYDPEYGYSLAGDPDYWMVEVYEGGIFGNNGTFDNASGDATAQSSYTDTGLSSYTMEIGSSAEYRVHAGGSAGDGMGSAESGADQEVLVQLSNFASVPLTFVFDSVTHRSVETTADSDGEASSGFAWTDVALEGQHSVRTSGSDQSTYVDTLFVDVPGGGDKSLYNEVVASGEATSPAPVPVPAAVWLFGSGLLGLAFVRRRI